MLKTKVDSNYAYLNIHPASRIFFAVTSLQLFYNLCKFSLWLFFFKGDARSAASDGSVVQNSYDAIEGGGLMGKALGGKMVVIVMELLRVWER